MFLIPLIAYQPFAIFAIAAIFSPATGWRVWALAPLAIIAMFAMGFLLVPSQIVTGFRYTRFAMQLRENSFETIDGSDLLEVLKKRLSVTYLATGSGQAKQFSCWVKPSAFMSWDGFVKATKVFTPAEGQAPPILGGRVFVYPTQWRVYIPGHPSELSDLQLFMLLHELGHATATASLTSMMSSRFGYLFPHIGMSTLLLVCVLPFHSPGMIVIIAPYIGILVILLLLQWLLLKGVAEDFEERQADFYAVSRVDSDWFGTYPAETVAKKLCRPRVGQGTVDTIDASRRIRAMARHIEDLRAGRRPKTQHSDSPFAMKFILALSKPRDVLMIMWPILLGITLTDVPLGLLLAVVAASVLGLLLLVVLKELKDSLYRFADSWLGIGELQDSDRSFAASLAGRSSHPSSKKILKGCESILFTPDQLDLVWDPESQSVVVYYSIQPRINFVAGEYDSRRRRLAIIGDRGQRLDLGVKLRSQIGSGVKSSKALVFRRVHHSVTIHEKAIPIDVMN